MTEHELNLIAEYAAGLLATEEVEAVEAKIASDPAARAEYEAQLAALAALSAAPVAELSDMERAALRTAAADELHLVREAPVEAIKSRRRPIPWARLGTVAAVLAGVVIAAPLLRTLSTTGADNPAEDFGDVAAEAPAATSADERLSAITPEDSLFDGQSESALTTPPQTATAAGELSEDSDASQGAAAPALEVAPLPDFGPRSRTELQALRNAAANIAPEDAWEFVDFAVAEGALEREGEGDPPDLAAACPSEAEEASPGWEDASFLAFAVIEDVDVLLFLVTPAGGGDELWIAFDEAPCEVRGVFGP